MKIGFCERDTFDNNGIICFVYDNKSQVDKKYSELEDISQNKPALNNKYNIYQFFATDPEGRTLEFQSFE